MKKEKDIKKFLKNLLKEYTKKHKVVISEEEIEESVKRVRNEIDRFNKKVVYSSSRDYWC